MISFLSHSQVFENKKRRLKNVQRALAESALKAAKKTSNPLIPPQMHKRAIN
jgi:hypothetical protein